MIGLKMLNSVLIWKRYCKAMVTCFLLLLLENWSLAVNISQATEEQISPIIINRQETETDRHKAHLTNKEELNENKFTNWQSDSATSMLEKLKSEMGIETVQKCQLLANQTQESTSTRTNQTKIAKTLAYSIAFEMCILKEKWFQISPTKSFHNQRPINSRKSFSKTILNKRKIDPKTAQYEDCLFKTRKKPSFVPGNCYWKEMTYYEPVFLNFWNQQGPDILYTFDNILYSKDNYAEENFNRLWYIISFIKSLAMEVENPMDIIEHIKLITEDGSKVLEEYNETYSKAKGLTNRCFFILANSVASIAAAIVAAAIPG